MSDDEFNGLINELIEGLPVTLAVTRLALLVRVLIELGGEPAADCLRAVMQLRGAGSALGDPTGPPGYYDEGLRP